MKSKLLTSAVTLTIILIFTSVFALPALGASSSYSFDMEFRYVSGKDNGMYHSLDSGSVGIRGSAYVYESRPGAVGPYDIKYSLYRDVSWLPDPEYGTVNGGINTTFDARFTSNVPQSDNFYLIIWKTEVDGHKVRGSGTLSN